MATPAMGQACAVMRCIGAESLKRVFKGQHLEGMCPLSCDQDITAVLQRKIPAYFHQCVVSEPCLMDVPHKSQQVHPGQRRARAQTRRRDGQEHGGSAWITKVVSIL